MPALGQRLGFVKQEVVLFCLESASEDEIKKLILCSSSKSCDLGPIPTSVLKIFLDILITPITDIINISMNTSTFPQNVKEAHVRPLLKKTYLPKN